MNKTQGLHSTPPTRKPAHAGVTNAVERPRGLKWQGDPGTRALPASDIAAATAVVAAIEKPKFLPAPGLALWSRPDRAAEDVTVVDPRGAGDSLGGGLPDFPGARPGPRRLLGHNRGLGGNFGGQVEPALGADHAHHVGHGEGGDVPRPPEPEIFAMVTS